MTLSLCIFFFFSLLVRDVNLFYFPFFIISFSHFPCSSSLGSFHGKRNFSCWPLREIQLFSERTRHHFELQPGNSPFFPSSRFPFYFFSPSLDLLHSAALFTFHTETCCFQTLDRRMLYFVFHAQSNTQADMTPSLKVVHNFNPSEVPVWKTAAARDIAEPLLVSLCVCVIVDERMDGRRRTNL